MRSIVVMGHGRFGGIRAAIEEASPLSATDFIGTWGAGVRELARDLDPTVDDDPVGRLRALEHRSVERSIEHLRTFPRIAAREDAGSLRLHGAWCDIAIGELHVPGDAGWSPMSEATP